MGFLNAITGSASQMSMDEAQKTYGYILATNEPIAAAYKVIRDMFIFTPIRLILVNVQGVIGKKVEVLSVPYRSIVRFSVETSGVIDLDAELRIWLSDTDEPIHKKFNRNVNIYEVQAILAQAIADASNSTNK